MSEDTFNRHLKDKSSFIKDAKEKLEFLEKDYIKKKIKLMDIIERLK
ncbi:MAG: hypothetical protein GYA62_04330 [Bacteroidales bacterium]|nr:hypothetical protein [Bacteroidales bacterium]